MTTVFTFGCCSVWSASISVPYSRLTAPVPASLPVYKCLVALGNKALPFHFLPMPTAKSSRYNLFFLLLAQLIWAVPTCSRVTPSHRSLSNSVSNWPGLSKSVAAAWYAGWHSSDFTLQDLSWCKYSMVFWAFA
jgi:hypothetical protein